MNHRDRLSANVIRWAVAFIESEEAQGSLTELQGTQSAGAPAEFLRLAEAVQEYKRRTQKPTLSCSGPFEKRKVPS